MSLITLKAHYDGKHLLLDEPFNLPVNLQLKVIIELPDSDNEKEEWTKISFTGLANAYSNAEPEYSLADIKS